MEILLAIINSLHKVFSYQTFRVCAVLLISTILNIEKMSKLNNAHDDQENIQGNKLDENNIEWDNGEATYGHAISDSPFKRKNIPDENHLSKLEESDRDVNEELKNINLSSSEDPSIRNSDQEKGLGGKDL